MDGSTAENEWSLENMSISNGIMNYPRNLQYTCQPQTIVNV